MHLSKKLASEQESEGLESNGATDQAEAAGEGEVQEMAASSAAAMQQQADADIPFREDYFLPEDEAGDPGTIRRDEVSSSEDEREEDALPSEAEAGNKVGLESMHH